MASERVVFFDVFILRGELLKLIASNFAKSELIVEQRVAVVNVSHNIIIDCMSIKH